MVIQAPSEVRAIISKFEVQGYEIYIVGGVVRDLVLGKPTTDWDFTTNATPDEILKLLGEDAFYDNKYGTVGIKYEGMDKPFEITTFRSEEGYSDGRHPDRVTWGKTIDEDLARRDFTINAMALNLELPSDQVTSNQFKLTDLYDGEKDLQDKVIRAVGNPVKRFEEDALRMMRAVRIATQLGFTIEQATAQAIQANASKIMHISAERIRDELLKILASEWPADGYKLLRSTGLSEYVLPEMEAAFGVEQKSPGRHHMYDVGTHSIETLRHCQSADPITRLAALLHDVGKVKTQRVFPDGRITFYNHEMESTKVADKVADRLRLSKAQKEKLVKLVRWHQFTMDEHMTDSAVRRIITNVGKDNVADLIALRIGDRIGSGAKPSSWRLEKLLERFEEVQHQPFSIPDLKINGRDVMEIKNVPSGPQVGKYLQLLFEEVTEKGLANEKEVLVERLRQL